MRLALLGPPGSGKGTQAQRICEAFDLTHLASGDILKVGIALQLSTTADAAKATKDPAAYGARALDEAINVLGQYTKAQLVGTGKNDAKAKLSARVALVYDHDVTGVYFTQFVIA